MKIKREIKTVKGFRFKSPVEGTEVPKTTPLRLHSKKNKPSA